MKCGHQGGPDPITGFLLRRDLDTETDIHGRRMMIRPTGEDGHMTGVMPLQGQEGQRTLGNLRVDSRAREDFLPESSERP